MNAVDGAVLILLPIAIAPSCTRIKPLTALIQLDAAFPLRAGTTIAHKLQLIIVITEFSEESSLECGILLPESNVSHELEVGPAVS